MGRRYQLRLFLLLISLFFLSPILILIFKLSTSLQNDNNTGRDICRQSGGTNFRCWLPPDMLLKGGKFDLYLRRVVSDKRIVYIIIVDTAHIELALNVYESSFKPLSVGNFLFVCTDRTAVDLLFVRGIECYNYPYPSGTDSQLIWRKQVRTKVILSALLLGYTAFHVDSDVVFLRDPSMHIDVSYAELYIQSDYVEPNNGFYLSKPTSDVISLHVLALTLGMTSQSLSEQSLMSRAIAILESRGQLVYQILMPELFPNGYYYFEQGQRMFYTDNKCDTCIIVHNDWMQTIEAKIYRFKENLLWNVDYGYYSNPNIKYIMYDNPLDFGTDNIEYELEALKNALFLGELLNRTVILPKFTCQSCIYNSCRAPTGKCALNTHIKIANFDQYFQGKYRENSFLSHPKIPKNIIKSISPSILIKTASVKLVALHDVQGKDFKENKFVFTPSNPLRGTLPEDVFRWFMSPALRNFSVLRFRCLYDIFKWPLPAWSTEFAAFEKNLKDSLVSADYRQNTRQQSLGYIQDMLVKLLSYIRLANVS